MIFFTHRTKIIPLAEKHIPEILEMYAEPDSNKFIAPLKNKNEDEFRSFLENRIASNHSQLDFWVVKKLDSNDFIGTVNLNQFLNTEINHIGCHLKRQFWNQKYALELMESLINYGFDRRELVEIYALVEDGHKVSSRLFDRLGFKFVEKRKIQGVELQFLRLNAPDWAENSMDNFMTVCTFVFPSDLYVIRGKLEAEGIECRLKDELTVQVHNFYSNAIGGVKLQVRKSSKNNAIHILREAGFKTVDDEKPSELWSKIDNFTLKIPLLNKVPVELRVIILVTVILTIGLLLLLSFSS